MFGFLTNPPKETDMKTVKCKGVVFHERTREIQVCTVNETPCGIDPPFATTHKTVYNPNVTAWRKHCAL